MDRSIDKFIYIAPINSKESLGASVIKVVVYYHRCWHDKAVFRTFNYSVAAGYTTDVRHVFIMFLKCFIEV